MKGKRWAELFDAAANGLTREDDAPDAVAVAELLHDVADGLRKKPRTGCDVEITLRWDDNTRRKSGSPR